MRLPWAAGGSAGPLGVKLATLCAALFIAVFSPETSQAFEKWERPLGWNPQYGPRYVVFWGGPVGVKDPPMGTCTYDHYASTPLLTQPPITPFEDFQVAKLFEERQKSPISLPKPAPRLPELLRLPFIERQAAERYAKLEEKKLPFPKLQNIPMLLRAAKVMVGEICSNFLRRLKSASPPTGQVAMELEGEAARLFGLALAVNEAVKKGENASTEHDNIYKLVGAALNTVRQQKNWDWQKYAYWLDASNAFTETGGSYYLPDLEKSFWTSSVDALLLDSTDASSPYGQVALNSVAYKDCSHFVASRMSAVTAKRELLCNDSFVAWLLALHQAGISVAGFAGDRGRQLLAKAIERMGKDLAEGAKLIQKESPFYPKAAAFNAGTTTPIAVASPRPPSIMPRLPRSKTLAEQ